jgi:hypothetical protein
MLAEGHGNYSYLTILDRKAVRLPSTARDSRIGYTVACGRSFLTGNFIPPVESFRIRLRHDTKEREERDCVCVKV